MTDGAEGTRGSVPDLVGVVLAAGAGTRLRPFTDHHPKALATVGGRTLLDLALERVRGYAGRVAVNAHHHAEQIRAALTGHDVHLEVESPSALGTAGALGNLRGWIDGAAVLVTNADAWYADPDAVRDLVAGWDGERPRLLAVPGGAPGVLGGVRYVGTALLPWWAVAGLAPEPTGLYEVSWRDLHAAGWLELDVRPDLVAVDCGTPDDLRRADRLAAEAPADTRRGE